MEIESTGARGRLVALLLVANVSFFGIVTMPTLSELDLLREQEQTSTQARDAARRHRPKGGAEQTASLVAKAERHLVGERDLPALADRIRKTAAVSGLEPLDIQYRSTKEPARS